jgi:aspartyl-tRNA(Asn)/glutamyl-tRNA(Gln) amidotransferase subunit B
MAAQPYQIVVGLEVHVQLLTRTKLFCGCSTQFGLPPNSATCPVCLGMPGVLPVMNRRAFELSLKAALALNCQIARFTKWDRKNYYYPDLPKNYQISQYDLPFSHDGWLEIDTGDGAKKVGIIRAHLEEDAGKNTHGEDARRLAGGGNGFSLVDLNRTGTPLLEIVSQPEINSPEEAVAYLSELRLLLRELEISDCEMQEGSLRCDANVNIRVPKPGGTHEATPIVEVKNLNSFRAVERAIKYEAERHFKEMQKDPTWRFGKVNKETAGWDDGKGITRVQRRKEEASDYRYFPEPDLVPVAVDDAMLDAARSSMGEVPAAARVRLASEYGLSPYDARVLVGQGRAVVGYYEQAAKACGDPKAAANWVTNGVAATLNERGISINEFPVSAASLAGLVTRIKADGLNNKLSREVYNRMLATGESADLAVEALGIKPVADEGQLLDIVRKAIAANPKAVEDYKAGNVKAADRIKGFIMKETKGKANTALMQKLLEQELSL